MALKFSSERERLKTILRDTVTLLCKTSLSYRDELKIEGVIGITVDEESVVLVHVNEAFSTKKVMQPNITSTSGSRSEIPFRRAPLEDVRGDLPEEIFIDSDYSCDDSTSARAVPITHHIKPRPSYVEARRHHKFRTFSNESIKSSTVSHRSNFPSSDTTESEHHEETCPIARSMPPALVPAIPIVPTENVDDIKEEEDEVIIYQPQGSAQSKSGIKMEKGKSATNQAVLTVHVDNNMDIIGSNVTQEPARENVTTESSSHNPTEPSNNEEGSSNEFESMKRMLKRPVSSNLRPRRKRQYVDTTLEGDDSEFDDEELNDETPESPDTKRDVKRAMKKDESEKLPMETAGARRFPSCTLASKVIRRCLQSELVLPLVNKNYWATALRLKWRVNNDQAWKQIVRTRQECDMTIGGLDGVAFFVSAITGLSRYTNHKKKDGDVCIYAGISYWVAYDGTNENLSFANIAYALDEMDLDCEIKKLITHGNDPTLTDISSALFIGVKDHRNGRINKLIDHSTKVCFGTTSKKVPCVKFVINDIKVKPIVRQAHKRLSRTTFVSTLESWV